MGSCWSPPGSVTSSVAETQELAGVGDGVGLGPPQLVVMFMVQPESIPRSILSSSSTYKLHVPFGSVPLKTESADPPDGAGAGPGNGSPAPALVGLNVPETSGPSSSSAVVAASS